MTDVAIIIVTWNSRSDLVRCLSSIADSAKRCSTNVVIVDNASSDDTVAVAGAMCPSATIVQNPHNDGFASANNRALRALDARYALLLNADTLLKPQAIDVLVSFMDAHTDAWACGPAMFNGDGTPQRTGVRFPTLWNLFVVGLLLDRLFPTSRIFGSHRALFEDPTRIREVDFVQGSCLLIRASAISSVGVLDESFFMYFEETDWCFRAKRQGGKTFLVPSAEVVHYGGGEWGHYDAHRLEHYHRSLLNFYKKHHSPSEQVFVRLLVLLLSVIRLTAWVGIASASGRHRKAALSSARGYARVIRNTILGL
jgi:GT2 family glycosyltransferase